MVRLVVIDTKTLKYKVFENKKCVAEFTVDGESIPTSEDVEDIRTRNYSLA